jgi:glutathione S-transferase
MYLYSHVRSPWCRKTEWALLEMGLASNVTVEVIGLGGVNTDEAMKSMKEKCGTHATVPALVDGDFVLTESSAVVYYLADAQDYSGAFLPTDAKMRARIMQWDRICDINLGANILSPWLRNTVFLGNKVADPHVFQKSRENFAKLQELLQAQLSKSNFLAGDNFTYADVGMSHLLNQLARVDGPKVSDSNVTTWLEKCLSKPNYKSLADRN